MSKSNYDSTPSFYNSQEVFEKYLGLTSYYKGLQNNVIKLCRMAKSKRILELGSATGTTSFAIAKAIPESTVIGIDMRSDIVSLANDLKKENGIDNVSFLTDDFCSYEKYSDSDFIVMLYSFHHIVDPEENKWSFLRKVYTSVNEGTYLCIAETFLPCEPIDDNFDEKTKALWDLRVKEGDATTFWESLLGITDKDVTFAEDVGSFCGAYEGIAGDEVLDRKTEFLVTTDKLCEEASKIGWKVVINKPCNSVGESILLFKKQKTI